MSSVDHTDYDRKYKEDLEKAEALSLESHALEKFKQEKQRAEIQNSLSSLCKQGVSTKNEPVFPRSSLDNRQRSKDSISKATQRPRPGCIETRSIHVPKLPPPQRRDSVLSTSNDASCTNDLMTFPSPPSTKHHQSSVTPECYSRSTQGQSNLSSPSLSDLPPSIVQFSLSEPSSIKKNLENNLSLKSRNLPVCNQRYAHQYISNSKDNFFLYNLNIAEKKSSGNLIDLNTTDNSSNRDKNVRVSLLEAFDPLIINSTDSGNLEDRIYESYDPFDFLYSTLPCDSTSISNNEPIYSTVVKSTSSPTYAPPLPPRNAPTNSIGPLRKADVKCSVRLYENIKPIRRTTFSDPDLIAFYNNINRIREKFDHADISTNTGIIISPVVENYYPCNTSIKLIIHCSSLKILQPITFTCDVNSSVEHVLMHVTYEVGFESIEDFILKVYGLAEYLELNSSLSDYEYIHNCIKLEKDIELTLLRKDAIVKTLLRTADDDKQDRLIQLEDLLPKEPVQPISHESLVIVLDTLENEMDRVIASSKEVTASYSNVQPRSVLQSVKAVCALLGNIETLQITQALDNFIHAFEEFSSNQHHSRSKPEIVSDSGNYSVVVFPEEKQSLSDMIHQHCEHIRAAVQGLIKMYCYMFKTDFQLKTPYRPISSFIWSSEINDPVLVYIGCIHRIFQKWSAEEFSIEAQIYHGTRPIGIRINTQPVMLETSTSLYKRAIFDTWLNFEGVSISSLPRESRVVFTVYGHSIVEEAVHNVELGWAAMQLFNYNGQLMQGSFLLPFWEGERSKRLGPAPSPGTHPRSNTDPIIGIEFQEYGYEVKFPNINITPACSDVYDFKSLDCNTQQQLLEIINEDTFSNPQVEDREVLWEKRNYLLNHPQALPKVLLAAHSWDHSCLEDLHSLLHSWSQLDPVSALQLLLPCFADNEVRSFAVKCINKFKNDELIDYLPQIVQALKYENYEASDLSMLLLERSLMSQRVAHHFYWLLVQELPGGTPQNTCESGEQSFVAESRYHLRLQLVLRALWAISGEALRKTFTSQQLLIKELSDIAERVITSKESTRQLILTEGLNELHSSLMTSPTCLPISPSLYVTGIHVSSSSYFNSYTLPLKINFTCDEAAIIPAIFKVGDDLKQDMLTLQMIRIMNKLWLKEGLDLKIVTFSCVPTGYKRGMIEMVTEAETLRKIQGEFGVTGSFKEWPIAEWLGRHNPSALDYQRAVANFTASCAGYCVATYVLGIGDRHNDNIMLKTSGHLFHIDFGKFLGEAQMFGNFKRDRTPFVLTSDMAYVINGGDKPSAKFHHFVDLCCNAFNIVRKHRNILFSLFGLMASSGTAGLTADSVHYVQNALLPDLSNAEAAATFARMIQSSLKSWFTQINFFLHNLAQLRFAGDHNEDELLSFVPKRYSIHQEGRLKSVEVYGYQKRYDPEKYYVFILKVERINQKDPSYLFRSYKEFSEFHQKLCLLFPLVKCYSLPSSSLHMRRSNIKQVADKRMYDIKKFLQSLFMMADEICHSDLVYTFFHPLLRDQQESSIHEQKLKEPRKDRASNNSVNFIKGQIKISVHYYRETLWVMIYHVRELSWISGGQEPSTYVKVYLLPDLQKATKRKTKVVRKNCHPSFMEMLEYRMPLEIVQQRFLQATVWNHDTLQENEFLGGTTINLANLDLTKEVMNWYPLGNVSRGIIASSSY